MNHHHHPPSIRYYDGDGEEDDPNVGELGYHRGGGGRERAAFWDPPPDAEPSSRHFPPPAPAIATANATAATAHSTAFPTPPDFGSSVAVLREWEREAMMRDGLEDGTYEIGGNGEEDDVDDDRRLVVVDDDDGGGGNEDEDDRVKRDIRDLEDVEMDNISNASSRKEEEVANAYRDYLRSIRDGGFESYLDDDDDENPVGGGGGNGNGYGNIGADGDDAGIVEIEEDERRVAGSMYGVLYGVRDVRAMTTTTISQSGTTGGGGVLSPYKEWRARARELALRESERERRVGGRGGGTGDDDYGDADGAGGGRGGGPSSSSSSSSSSALDRFRERRKWSAGVGVGVGGRAGGITLRNGIVGDGNDVELPHRRRTMSIDRAARCKMGVILACMLIALSGGIAYYTKESSDGGGGGMSGSESDASSGEGTGEGGGDVDSSASNPGMDGDGHSVALDAILNALRTFDPFWYDRRSGWEVRRASYKKIIGYLVVVPSYLLALVVSCRPSTFARSFRWSSSRRLTDANSKKSHPSFHPPLSLTKIKTGHHVRRCCLLL
jgi:hypothetical protein